MIPLIPKQESSLLDLKNWRPITLLNNDYKIASKAIAKRIEVVLPRLIHTDQTGFIKGRYIGENIRLISDLLEQTQTEKKFGYTNVNGLSESVRYPRIAIYALCIKAL